MKYDYSIHTVDTDIALLTRQYALRPRCEHNRIEKEIKALERRRLELVRMNADERNKALGA